MDQFDNLPPHEDEKRHKTGGEHLFNATTYGGLALVGNEFTATKIVNEAQKPNAIGRVFQATGRFFEQIGPKGKLPYIQQRMNYINYAIIGGFAMVPFIKFLEDHKGSLVRFADRIIHGKASQNDPARQRAYEEMENAPRQSWGSLMQGRVVTVAAAYTVDSTIGWRGGMLARNLQGTQFEKFSSLDHVSDLVADKLSPAISRALKHDATKIESTKQIMRQGTGLLTLSAVLTVLFYGTSKFFAQRRANKIEQREEAPATIARPHAENVNDNTPIANDNHPLEPQERPTTRVAAIDRAPATLLAQERSHEHA